MSATPTALGGRVHGPRLGDKRGLARPKHLKGLADLPLSQAAPLAADLQAIFAAGQGGAKTQAQVAQAIADAIDDYVKQAVVSTVTTCPAGAGTGTGTVG